MKFTALSIFILLFAWPALAQEEVRPQGNRPPQRVPHRSFHRQHLDTVQLPFFDDFSNFPEYHIDSLWEGSQIYFNSELAQDPPSVGVATLDGWDEAGWLYKVDNRLSSRLDTLTSAPIDLSGLSEGDSVYFTFFYQPGGIGDAPNGIGGSESREDSLILEFKPDSFRTSTGWNDSGWVRVYGQDGPGISERFKRVRLLLRNDTSYNWFHSGFRFRFVNRGSLVNDEGIRSGSYDLWHIDYVLMDKEYQYMEPILDVAATEPVHTILTRYYSMPWSQFVPDSNALMKDSIPVAMHNLSNNSGNLNYGYSLEVYPSGPQLALLKRTSSNFFGNSRRTFYTRPFGMHYSPSEDSVELLVKTFGNSSTIPDNVPANDTAYHIQRFHNYFAYDDGSAEAAYGLVNGSGKIAVEFYMYQPEELRGVYLHFNPADSNLWRRDFSIWVWQELSAVDQPANEDVVLHRELARHAIFSDTRNGWVYYEFDSTIALQPGPFYVGIVQDEPYFLNLGLDLNYQRMIGFDTPNPYLFYNVNGVWKETKTSGAPMVRPVVGSEPFVGLPKQPEQQMQVEVFPNPARDWLQLRTSSTQSLNLRLLSLTGQVLLESNSLRNGDRLQLPDLTPGLYLVQMIDPHSVQIHTQKLVISQ